MKSEAIKPHAAHSYPPSAQESPSAAHHVDSRDIFVVSRAAQACPAGRPPRIVLTGGPCAGKTTVLQALAERGKQDGYRVFQVPEAATLLVGGGICPPEDRLAFENDVTDMQLQMEDTLHGAAARVKDAEAFVVQDRGVNDVNAYLDGAEAEQFMRERGWSYDTLGLDRYDLVVEMVTAADGAESHYNYNDGASKAPCNNTARMDDPVRARSLDQRIHQAWSNFPHRLRVGNDTDFAGKVNRVLEAVMCFVQLQSDAAHRGAMLGAATGTGPQAQAA